MYLGNALEVEGLGSTNLSEERRKAEIILLSIFITTHLTGPTFIPQGDRGQRIGDRG